MPSSGLLWRTTATVEIRTQPIAMGSWLRRTSSAAAMMPKSENAAMLRTRVEGTRYLRVTGGEQDIHARQHEHDPRHRQQGDQLAEGRGNALAAVKMVERRDGVAQHGRGQHGAEQQVVRPQPVQRAEHRQEALGHVEQQAHKAPERPAVQEHVAGAGLPSLLTASMSMCRTRRGIISLNITLPSRNPAPISASQ